MESLIKSYTFQKGISWIVHLFLLVDWILNLCIDDEFSKGIDYIGFGSLNFSALGFWSEDSKGAYMTGSIGGIK